jgi:transcriptional regulator with XRE-family HTH domain
MLVDQAPKADPHVDGDWLAVRQALGTRIRTLRMNRNWSQQKLADSAGTRQAKVSLLESGRIEPELGLVYRIARTFEVTIPELFGGEETRKRGRPRSKPAPSSSNS